MGFFANIRIRKLLVLKNVCICSLQVLVFRTLFGPEFLKVSEWFQRKVSISEIFSGFSSHWKPGISQEFSKINKNLQELTKYCKNLQE